MASRLLALALTLATLTSCRGLGEPQPQTSGQKYSSCLAAAAAGSSRLPLDNIRALCAEASGVIDVQYSYDKSGTLLPLADFTKCYEKEKKELEAKGVQNAARLAKLSCKYPDVQ